jgi:hypothetical protein
MEATKMLGRPRMVDEASLASLGSVCILFRSLNPAGSRTPSCSLLISRTTDYDETDDMSRSETHWKRIPQGRWP